METLLGDFLFDDFRVLHTASGDIKAGFSQSMANTGSSDDN